MSAGAGPVSWFRHASTVALSGVAVQATQVGGDAGGGVDLAIPDCWDCPITMGTLSWAVGAVLGLACVGIWLVRRESKAAQFLGGAIAGLGLLWSLATSMVVPRWGLIRSANPLGLYDSSVVRAVLLVTTALFAAGYITALVTPRRGKRARSEPRP